MTDETPKFISVIIPAYRQEKTIGKNLVNVKNVLEGLGFDFEIIVVADGGLDKTYEEARKVEAEKIKVFGYAGRNRGKGYALRYGAVRASGEIVVFLDAGMEINPAGIGRFWQLFKENAADIVVGSKRHPDSKVNYPLSRRITSFFYQLLVWLLFGLKVGDTQTGLKMFKREVLEKVLPRLLIKDYAIDVEILAVAHRLGYRRIFEAPVDVNYSFADLTHAATLATIWRMAKDTLAVFYRLKVRHYYDDGNERRWIYDPELEMKVNVG